ncbi:hypothetical protein [Paenibacillus sp. P36]|uniref:hypothetical protein n=1 Tax=Paenibacillus sp. P36 TaxID=3342538 RepID=UPI0038B2EB4F
MKGFLIHTLIVGISYLSGVIFYKAAMHLLAIPKNSEIDLLYPWITIFFIFFALPIYYVLNLFLRFFKFRSMVTSTILKTAVLVVFSLFSAIMVPFIFGGFGYLGTREFFFSEFAIILYSFFIGTSAIFSICSSVAENYHNKPM